MNTVGVAQHRGLGYGDVAAVRMLVREACSNAFGAGGLASQIAAGARVLLKPNWVTHVNRSHRGEVCLVTQLAFVEAVLLEVLEAYPASVVIADAPIQSAQFDRIVPAPWRARMSAAGGPIPVSVRDLRNVVSVVVDGHTRVRSTTRTARDVMLFDLEGDSLLDEVASDAAGFRCTNYNPQRTTDAQRRGVHKFVICQEALEADVVINLPKLKTHGKAGVTAALKNLVGINGDKDYLPHHRVGSPKTGGDCYSDAHPAKALAERLLDAANRRIGHPRHHWWSRAANAAIRATQDIGRGGLEGAWHGNDTVWRMALDLNRIVMYGRPDGTMSDSVQRTVVSVTDAIVAGDGEGPLAPEPVELGLVTAASSSAVADLVHATLMGFDWRKIPLVFRAFERMRWPLSHESPDRVRVITGGRQLPVESVGSALGYPFRAPRGWRDHVENRTH